MDGPRALPLRVGQEIVDGPGRFVQARHGRFEFYDGIVIHLAVVHRLDAGIIVVRNLVVTQRD